MVWYRVLHSLGIILPSSSRMVLKTYSRCRLPLPAHVVGKQFIASFVEVEWLCHRFGSMMTMPAVGAC